MTFTVFADGGEMTAARRTAAYVYGSWTVTLPEGRDQVETDDRIKDGFVAKVNNQPRGRFDHTFVRADAEIDMQSATSNLEPVLDEAFSRTDGDVLFQKDVTGDGLNGTAPGVDYAVGDVVRVGIWGRFLTLPVTGVGIDRVHVGGELIRDRRATAQHNNELRKAIANERAARLKSTAAVSTHVAAVETTANSANQAAGTAQDTADTAHEKALRALAEAQETTAELVRRNSDLLFLLTLRTPRMYRVEIPRSSTVWEHDLPRVAGISMGRVKNRGDMTGYPSGSWGVSFARGPWEGMARLTAVPVDLSSGNNTVYSDSEDSLVTSSGASIGLTPDDLHDATHIRITVETYPQWPANQRTRYETYYNSQRMRNPITLENLPVT